MKLNVALLFEWLRMRNVIVFYKEFSAWHSGIIHHSTITNTVGAVAAAAAAVITITTNLIGNQNF